MQLFLDILIGVTLPILALVGLGWGMQRWLALDIPTLTRLQVYILIPGALIYFPTATQLPLGTVWPVVWFSLLHFALLFLLGWGTARALGMSRNVAGMMALVAVFSNSGNYGIPLVQLAFPEDYLLYQSAILSLHAALIAPAALFALKRDGDDHAGIWRTLLGSPLLPAAALGYLLKGFEVQLPQMVAVPLRLIADAFTPMALLLLGVQLAAIEVRVERRPLVAGMALRMLIAPASAWLLAVLFGFPPHLTAFLVVSASVPAGVLISIFATEFRTEPELASMMVFVSTVVSALAVTGWIYAVRYAGLQ